MDKNWLKRVEDMKDGSDYYLRSSYFDLMPFQVENGAMPDEKKIVSRDIEAVEQHMEGYGILARKSGKNIMLSINGIRYLTEIGRPLGDFIYKICSEEWPLRQVNVEEFQSHLNRVGKRKKKA